MDRKALCAFFIEQWTLHYCDMEPSSFELAHILNFLEHPLIPSKLLPAFL